MICGYWGLIVVACSIPHDKVSFPDLDQMVMVNRSDKLGCKIDHLFIQSLDDFNLEADLDLLAAFGGGLDVELSPPNTSSKFPRRNFNEKAWISSIIIGPFYELNSRSIG